MNGWTEGEPPKDGERYVAIGRIVWEDAEGGGSHPFLIQVRYGRHKGWEGWLDNADLAVASGVEDRVCIDYWIRAPWDEGKTDDRSVVAPQEGGAA